MRINKDELFSEKYLSEPRYHENQDFYTVHTIEPNVHITVRHHDDAVNETYSGVATAVVRDLEESNDYVYVGDYIAPEDIVELFILGRDMMPFAVFQELFVPIKEEWNTVIDLKVN